MDCAPPYDRVFWTSGRNLRQGSTVTERFGEVLTDAGFDVAGQSTHGSAHGVEPALDRERARFHVTAELRHVSLELCRRRHWLTGGDQGISGVGTVKLDWAVHTVAEGRLVHRLTTTGTAQVESGVDQGDVLLIEEAFATAAEALAADPGFRAVLSRGGAVAQPLASTMPAVSSAPLASTDAPSSVSTAGSHPPLAPGGSSAALAPPVLWGGFTITGPPVAHSMALDPVAKAMPALVRVGNGRGVVIGEAEGRAVILTASAGVDTTVKVQPAASVTLDGLVEARDPLTGLALVRVPARLTALPLRQRDATVSEMVLAPVRGGGDQAAGIVGSVRPDRRLGVDLIQADLDGPEPAAGDPLLDEAGNLLGLALESQPFIGPAAHGLALFVPATEALRRMGMPPIRHGQVQGQS